MSGTEYHLKACLRCGFEFKDPPIDEQLLMKCYAQSSFDHWQDQPDPLVRQFDRFARLIESATKSRRILDVGCFNGALLDYLGPEWNRYGIEPSIAAAEIARQRGINVLSPSLESLDKNTEPFDVIMAIDVLEHIVEPVSFFQLIQKHLKENGIFLVSTGNAHAFSWKMQESLYYYTRIPEHVSFYSKAAFDQITCQMGWKCAAYQFIPHKRLPTSRRIKDTIKNTVYTLGCKCRGLGISPLNRKLRSGRGPTYFSAKDHLIYVFQQAG
ncbi:bifunctional 3-demethylubiquinone-9 3-methyltransferase/ 2-octaprenyl-6-hydroxy phenol methylase [Bythopirellula polymerisocia]|uniref:Bifunctional 3-demethylubiquinone-9 3-methyltransferase/ 2-octaprenyl-6-hydroxy phenol methylase n=2 Tax=Bythopirellula polymerisocia TaxID=2528003 RepID=A0A5C6CX01_9BACT|nr:bifunctional 3-demethylubiquinone-9 3-methyltransferase/ 2-octaprenyl-6-hydroxy phenol methylase [Bythopirellula polymerisocia]